MPAGQQAPPSRMCIEGGRNCGSRFRGRTGHRPAQRRFQHAEPLLEPDRSHEPLYRHSNALDVTRILTAGKHGGAGLGRIDGQSGPWTSRLILLQRACMLEIMSWGGIHGSVSNSSPARLRPRSNESVAPMRFPLPWQVAGGQWLERFPGLVEVREASQSRAVSWVRILVRDRGRECERLVATRLEQTAFNRLVDWGQHSMIPNGQPWLTVTFALTGVST